MFRTFVVIIDDMFKQNLLHTVLSCYQTSANFRRRSLFLAEILVSRALPSGKAVLSLFLSALAIGPKTAKKEKHAYAKIGVYLMASREKKISFVTDSTLSILTALREDFRI